MFFWDVPLRQEARRGFAGNIILSYPKVTGVGWVQVAGTPTCTLYRYDQGAAGQTLGTPAVTVNNPSGAAGSELRIPIDTSDTAAWLLGEAYRAEIRFVYGGVERPLTQYFDVVRAPMVSPVTLNDLVAEVADLAKMVARQAGAAATGRSAESQAAMYGALAWQDVFALLRAHCAARARVMPRLIVDQELLRRVTVAYAVARVYRAQGGADRGYAAALADEWESRAATRFGAMGDLQYDAGEDGTPSSQLGGFSVARVRRTWG